MTQLREAANSPEKLAVLLRKLQSDSENFAAKTVPLLCEAIENNASSLVECLLDHQVPMNPRLFMKATKNSSYPILQAFLDHGWDINTPIDSHTPPAIAFSYHDLDLTRWFLAKNANPNQRCNTYTDRTPLSIAFEEASFQTIQLLLDNGADIFQGQVMHYAAMRRLDDRLQVLDFLLQNGLPVGNIMYQDSESDYQYNMFSGIGTPLHYAAERGLLDSVKLLVERGASTRTRDPAGRTALDWAEFNNQDSVAQFLRPLFIKENAETTQFTDAPGHHFTTVPMSQFLAQSGYKLV